jgi:putative pyruvate formate lyase activating enzyme
MKNALDDPMVKRILPRYVKVVEGRLPANFQLAKRIIADLDRDLNNKQLWEMHKGLMKKFYETKEVVDKGKLKISDLEQPRFSLLDLKVVLAKDIIKECELCERMCHAKRAEGETGECRVSDCRISSDFIHMGEEPFISPSHTIFFMGCNFHCQFCQNWTVSQWFENGNAITPEIIADSIKNGKSYKCRNVNFVGGEPTPNTLPILQSLNLCKVSQAVVWNSNFYMSEKTMQLLDGIVDLYLSDFKYGNDECAEQLSKVRNYFSVITRNHLTAADQAELVIRHLVLPNHIDCCSRPVLKWISNGLKDRIIVNIMDQYTPAYKAKERMDIGRYVTKEEMKAVINYAKELKLNYITG